MAVDLLGPSLPPRFLDETATPQRSTDLSIVVVTHQSADCIEACLRSIEEQDPRPREIIVVDSGSTDRTAQITRRFSHVRWHPLGSNQGFASAANRGVEQTTAPLIAILNADVVLLPGWTSAMLSAADRHPRAASFASVQRLPSGTLDGAGDQLHFSGLAWRRGHGSPSQPIRDLETFSACAAAALYRREPFLAADGFEESYFCYFEDVDLGWRLRLAGQDCICVADAICDHWHGHASGGSHSNFATYHGHRNMVWTYLRCMPSSLLWPLLPAFVAAQAACVVAAATRGQAGLTLRAKIDAVRDLPRVLTERRVIQSTRIAPTSRIASAMNWALVPRRRSLRGREATPRSGIGGPGR